MVTMEVDRHRLFKDISEEEVHPEVEDLHNPVFLPKEVAIVNILDTNSEVLEVEAAIDLLQEVPGNNIIKIYDQDEIS